MGAQEKNGWMAWNLYGLFMPRHDNPARILTEPQAFDAPESFAH
jgi:hypothetical protein